MENVNLESIIDSNGIVVRWPRKKEEKLAVLEYLLTKFEPGKKYKEIQVNMILKQWHSFGDHALLRRELYDNFLMDRNPADGTYWVEEKDSPAPDAPALETRIVELPEIEIIGKEGLCTAEANIVQDLWKQANGHFSEVEPLAMREKDGSFVGFWGAMSDEDRSFKPWTENFTRGLYLAGVEVNRGSAVPDGWTKWTLPPRKYYVTEVVPERYAEIFTDVLTNKLAAQGFTLAGAVCDYTKPATGKNYLFFPVTEA